MQRIQLLDQMTLEYVFALHVHLHDKGNSSKSTFASTVDVVLSLVSSA